MSRTDDASSEARVKLRRATERLQRRVAQMRLSESARVMLLHIYQGKISSIPCECLGDKSAYDRATGTWKNVGTIDRIGRSWRDLKDAGLIDDYDSFGGYHYCRITKAGTRTAETLIALKVVEK